MKKQTRLLFSVCIKHLIWAILYTLIWSATGSCILKSSEYKIPFPVTIVLCVITLGLYIMTGFQAKILLDIILRPIYCKNIYVLSRNTKVNHKTFLRILLFIIFTLLYTFCTYVDSTYISCLKWVFSLFSFCLLPFAFKQNKIIQYAKEYMDYVSHGNIEELSCYSGTNFCNIIMQITSDYVYLHPEEIYSKKLEDNLVAPVSLKIMTTALITSIPPIHYMVFYPGCSDCADMLYIFLNDVINRQYKHGYISEEDLNLKIDSLS